MKYFELFEKLENIPGRKEKEKLIQENWSEELKQIFIRVYDFNRQSYTNKFIKIPYKEKESMSCDTNITSIVEFFDFLNKQGSTNNKGKFATFWYLDGCVNELKQKWDKRILQKDLKIGISEKTLNKLFGDFIPVFEVMLAKKVENIDELTFPIVVQPKLDGIRCLKIEKTLYGRNGKLIANEKLYEHLKGVFDEEKYVFDGELYSHEIGFNEILSQINSDSKELHPSIRYVVYDLLSISEWQNQKCITSYNDRWQRTKSFIKNVSNCEWIGGIVCNSIEEINEYYKKCLGEGYEGVMVKSLNGLYDWKRVEQHIMGKIKPTEEYDCKILEIKEGTGKYEKNFGAFVVDYNGVVVNVGSGYSDKERESFWTNKTELLGKWITVKCQEVTKDGSLRFPIFVRLRDSKD